jgi:hypothetical protein
VQQDERKMMNQTERLIADLLSNRGFTALAHETERIMIERARPPVDLRKLPRDQWDELCRRDVTLSDAIRKFTDGHDGAYTETEVQSLTDALETYHGVREPFYIAMRVPMQQTGRAWIFEEAAAPFLTGFVLEKEEL